MISHSDHHLCRWLRSWWSVLMHLSSMEERRPHICWIMYLWWVDFYTKRSLSSAGRKRRILQNTIQASTLKRFTAINADVATSMWRQDAVSHEPRTDGCSSHRGCVVSEQVEVMQGGRGDLGKGGAALTANAHTWRPRRPSCHAHAPHSPKRICVHA